METTWTRTRWKPLGQLVDRIIWRRWCAKASKLYRTFSSKRWCPEGI